jgi:hypothetical protein
MKKYLASLIFRIDDPARETAEFDIQFRMIDASDKLSAFYKARDLGVAEQTGNATADTAPQWKFIDVSELFELTALGDGEQVFSQSVTDTDEASYIGYIRRKARDIQAAAFAFA